MSNIEPRYDLDLTKTWFSRRYGDITTIHKIGSAIRDCLSDLISMPPKPVLDRVVVADAIRTDENGREHHAEISENV